MAWAVWPGEAVTVVELPSEAVSDVERLTPTVALASAMMVPMLTLMEALTV
ncbi:hypothetical protein HUT16_00055 [Kitasatospora sp. NA04385]|uniref:hypothetical protein n=1 Tax=Kitasatospora sp. NA04385 TaxID=2742135 RepID=UPI00158FC956|nr:hypothetical protein [Kitasatospora sp. NA04385]QKW17671.1 hypothetical protein HUT16_00055 [Kitasatospora sp. NA04385]